MIEKTKKVYYCEFCKKRSFQKAKIEKHEPICYANAENTPACFNCKHFVMPDKGERGFFCRNFNRLIHTKSAEVKGLIERYPEHFEDSLLMPVKCIGFEPLSEPIVENVHLIGIY